MARKGLPRVVDVCGVRFRVRRPAKVTLEGEEVYGTFDAEAMTIDIQRGISQERAEWTFRHEVAHAAYDLSGIDQKVAELVPDADIRGHLEESLIKTWFPAYDAALKGKS